MICDHCGQEYERIAQHWAWNEKHRPELSQKEKDMLKGLLMGDACIDRGSGTSTRKNCGLVVTNTNKEFLEEIKETLSIPSTITKSRTKQESYENFGLDHDVSKDGFSEFYRLQIASHPYFNQLDNWYEEGEKKFPEDLDLSKEILTYWYLCDGGVERGDESRQPRMRISAYNESGNQHLLDMFDTFGVEPKWNNGTIYFSVEDSKKLWKEMKSLKSFRDKFPIE